jgi:hypothetical protein
VTLPTFQFRRGTGKETLRFPLSIPARLAVLDAEFHLGANMRAFEPGDIRGLLDYGPEALALPLDSALSMADRKLRGLLELPSLKFALVVLSSVDSSDSGPLAIHHRDLLWKAFGLPVFDQLRGRNGRVIARECEVHDGLHFDANARIEIPDSFLADIVPGHCDCGIESPRLRYRIVETSLWPQPEPNARPQAPRSYRRPDTAPQLPGERRGESSHKSA